ncbi:MAG: hypothetical protein HFJ54_04410 [Clostridia bacterium]|nr:hypothetical protein [Clostridia bacterium]
MAENKKRKMKPAGKNDEFDLTYTHFAAAKQRPEILTGDGERFDNVELLKTLGFSENEQGVLALKTADYEAEISETGEIIRRKKDGRVLTESKKAKEEDER